MLFNSCTFLFFFLPVCIIVYYIIKPIKWKNYWLLLMSLLFYAWGGIRFFSIICISILINYAGGYWVDYFTANGKEKLRKLTFLLVIVTNIGLLGYWKYFTFFLTTINSMLHTPFPVPEIILPIGISFYTFQGMSYVIDVYQRKVPVQKNIGNISLYIALFPQLIAGPIVRYTDISKQIEERTHTTTLFTEGIRRFTIGLAKKAILANSLAINADAVFALSSSVQNTTAVSWIGAISYSLQIYFDFSGYSDMAIGLGEMFGFHIPENFNYPYISSSVADFWRRWHISLGMWLRNYIYIPLGGSRKGKKHKILNTLIVFAVSGLWHGANWTFILWGIYYGILISLSLLLQPFTNKLSTKIAFCKTFLFRIIKIAVTDLIAVVGWVLFKSDTVSNAVLYLKTMFGFIHSPQPGYTWEWYLTKYNICILCIALVAMLPIGNQIIMLLKKKVSEDMYCIISTAGTSILLLISLMYVITSTYNPFIYFQF